MEKRQWSLIRNWATVIAIRLVSLIVTLFRCCRLCNASSHSSRVTHTGISVETSNESIRKYSESIHLWMFECQLGTSKHRQPVRLSLQCRFCIFNDHFNNRFNIGLLVFSPKILLKESCHKTHFGLIAMIVRTLRILQQHLVWSQSDTNCRSLLRLH